MWWCGVDRYARSGDLLLHPVGRGPAGQALGCVASLACCVASLACWVPWYPAVGARVPGAPREHCVRRLGSRACCDRGGSTQRGCSSRTSTLRALDHSLYPAARCGEGSASARGRAGRGGSPQPAQPRGSAPGARCVSGRAAPERSGSAPRQVVRCARCPGSVGCSGRWCRAVRMPGPRCGGPSGARPAPIEGEAPHRRHRPLQPHPPVGADRDKQAPPGHLDLEPGACGRVPQPHRHRRHRARAAA